MAKAPHALLSRAAISPRATDAHHHAEPQCASHITAISDALEEERALNLAVGIRLDSPGGTPPPLTCGPRAGRRHQVQVARVSGKPSCCGVSAYSDLLSPPFSSVTRGFLHATRRTVHLPFTCRRIELRPYPESRARLWLSLWLTLRPR
ncbi:unnamed protein product [Lampetra fluviatilis]